MSEYTRAVSGSGRPGREMTVDRSVLRRLSVMPSGSAWIASAAAAGLLAVTVLAVTVLSLGGPPAQAETGAYPVSAARPDSVYASVTAWLEAPGGRSFAAQNGTASQKPLPATAARPVPPAAAPEMGQADGKNPVLGRIVLIAVAIAAAGAFAVLQVRARSRRMSPATGSRRRSAVYDWRTLPPKYQDDPANEWPVADQEDYGPLWRYGTPRGYGRDYDPGPDPGYGPVPNPGFGPGSRLPWGFPDDAPHDGWP